MNIEIVVRPRESMTWAAFRELTPRRSIALDGLISDVGPSWDEAGLRANFDHHTGVVREATMSTSMQVFFAIKGGLMTRMREDAVREISGDGLVAYASRAAFGGAAFGARAERKVQVWINDPDQDTALATWLLGHHHLFVGVQSHPIINRLLTLTDRWDITGGAFPTALDDTVVETHAWVFDPYTSLRVSGALASADAAVMRNCLDAVHGRLDKVLMGQCERKPLRRDAVVLHDSNHGFKIIDETGGNEARYLLFSQGMDAFVSRVATRPDGRFVYSIGRRSRYIDFQVPALYGALNLAEPDQKPFLAGHGWGGSDIIGGSPRLTGSSLSWEQIRDVLERTLQERVG
jgi:hypothetical protein